MFHVKINNKSHEVPKGTTILQACRHAGIKIPTLCYLEGVHAEGSCGVCVVEVKGSRTLQRSCITAVAEGMEIQTNTEAVRKARKINTELLLANHPTDCLVCDKNEYCTLRQLSSDLGIKNVSFERTHAERADKDETSPSLVRDPEKCILCRRCIAVCAEKQSVSAIGMTGRGAASAVSTFGDMGLGNAECANCGQCILVCPTGALMEKSEIDGVWKAINDPKKTVVVQTAPAVRVAIGEDFGLEPGTAWTGKMVAALRRLGFDKVFDTDFTADLTIMEEGTELITRLKTGGTLPMITSCSPGWIKFAEHFFPGVLAHLSTCKSPQQMFGAVAKTYYAEKLGVDPRDMVVVSIMPCVAKKFEARRPEMNGAFHYWQKKMGLKDSESFQDVDFVLSTREAAKMIKEAGLDFPALPNEEFDQPLGMSTGAAVIFGATGGVMEAALRTAYEVVTGKALASLDFKAVRGMDGIKTAEVDLAGTKLKVAVAHTLSNARKLLEEIRDGKSPYHFIEVMTCEGGCIGGGGQPFTTNLETRKKRASAIYKEDAGLPLRKSHDNPVVQTLYKEFLEKPLGEKSHHLLHTHYTKRGVHPGDVAHEKKEHKAHAHTH
ncbi:MAG: NADH-dependent [FeFe] hydrogenase, group A6 [Elusimicrobiales bacterium]|nr:NADH-dependent [FeFe] hydrogenase, group A6 [Elusimicrobiales bacterium]